MECLPSFISAGDCFELGRIAYNGGDYYHTILWMQQALSRLDEQSDLTVDKALLLDYLAFAVYSVSYSDYLVVGCVAAT